MTTAPPPPSLSGRLAQWGWRLVRTFDLRRPSWVETLPRVTIETAASLPAVVIHLGAALVAVATAAVVSDGRGQWVVSILLIAPMAVRPVGALPALFGLWVGLQVAVDSTAATPLQQAGVILGVHLVAVLTSVTAGLRPIAHVELRVFAGPLRRLAGIQAVVQPLVWSATALSDGDWSAPWLLVFAAIGLAGLAWIVVLRPSSE